MSKTRARVSVLTIGDELLSGEILDTNLSSIARALSDVGFAITKHITASDDVQEIVGAVRELAAHSDVLLISGGLGPTTDDLTCESVAKAVGRDLEFHPHLEQHLHCFFESMGRTMSDENLKQAYLPEGSIEMSPRGTAPGFMLDHDGALIAVMPGVPSEMEQMLMTHVLPEIEKRFPEAQLTVTKRLTTFGAGESDVASLVGDLIGDGPVQYGFLAQGGQVVIKLTACGSSMEEALQLVETEQEKAANRLGHLVYTTEDETLEEVVGNALRNAGLTVSVAESVTAGMVCARIANVPGSSDYFLGGIVTYSIDKKRMLLDVRDELLLRGAVSRDVAESMAEEVRAMFSSDIGLATTGVAGPDSGIEKKPVGTVCLGLADDKGTVSIETRLPGDRQMVRNIATLAALSMIRMRLIQP